ncbi:beta-propeller domain-containing protein [Desulfosporosinus youngiae]|uniref:Secreted protein with C-terminal beta-propeller domain n=1 Tax=Desulfosporosinus youngiae DSM 17734 TaxID=768710 RepID=H5XUY7_9FIRM|nr:beta-propeller domain-containing protein [Desulfosporosinus youngiae]EHQ89439.1 secreted protein with C-terminal beta-propeller domain [Desulfosporosinus youngiae DSM 17734]
MKKARFLVVLLMVFVFLTLPELGKATDEEVTVTQEHSLPTVETAENLRNLLKESQSSRTLLGQGRVYAVDVTLGSVNKSAQTVDEAAPSSANFDMTTGNSGHSTTNLQVAGVDEADIIKNDGQYIYQVNQQELIVTQAYPANQMHILSRIGFKEGEFTPRELYVDDHYLVLIGNTYYPETSPSYAPKVQPQVKGASQVQIYPPVWTPFTTKAIVYDLADKSNLQKLREVELDGDYVSSRKIGSNLYLIANKYLDTYRIMEQGEEPPLPSYRDTAGQGDFSAIGYQDIRYFPQSIEANYLLIAALDLDQKDKEMQVAAYLGSGQAVYASASNLYVAVTQYQQVHQSDPAQPSPESAAEAQPASNSSSKLIPGSLTTTTALYKFGLAQGGTTYKAKGEVPGTILNQFALDEDKGCLRIATTTGQIWRTDEFTSKNNVYVLDENLQLTGRIEDIAPGEKIYSVRFMGDRGYLVTFKKVDPFFVLDLKDPTAPTILGALKIPGYSDYLHPYDENHIIGFGKDTIEVSQNSGPGSLTVEAGDSTAFYQGLKLAVFDVTDVAHPVEMFKTTIGDRGTDSELLHNHKALLFDKERGILSFPVTLMEVANSSTANSRNGFPDYGQFTYQGAYVYHFDLVKGFTLRGRITHLKDEDILKSGQVYLNSSKAIERIIYIQDTLYTISPEMIKANDLRSLQEKNSLILK